MNHTVDTDDVIEVSANGLQVQKTFTTDEFPVPAIRFYIESENDEPVSFRLSEEIPETFPMDGVGFHPEYHSENWTAFQDNHVEFTGTLEPGEDLVTVYGIRIDDESEVENFLTEPELVDVDSEESSTPSDADTVDDSTISNIVAEDRNQVVKDMLTGESEGIPGLGNEGEKPGDETSDDDADPIQTGTEADERDDDTEAGDGEVDTDGDAIEQDLDLENVDTDLENVDTVKADTDVQDDAPDIDLGFTEDEIPDPVDDPETAGSGVDSDDATDDDATDDESANTVGEADDTDEETEGPKIELDLEAAAAKMDESVGGGDIDDSAVPDDDEDNIGDVDSAGPIIRSTVSDEPVGERLVREIREGDLSDEDLESLRSLLGVEPSGSERAKLSHLQSRVEEVAAYAAALEEFLDEHDGGATLIEEFKSELSTFEDELETLENRMKDTKQDLKDIDSRTATVESDLGGLNERIDPIESELDTLDENLEEVRSDVESVDKGLSTVETELEELEGTVTDVKADVVDINEWREQLGSMFSE